MTCTKAIIPVAGYGSRRLPIAKAVDKYMLPVLNRPVIDYVIKDCIAAGVTDFYVVVSKGGGKALSDYYGRNEGLEAYLKEMGKEQLLPEVAPLPDNIKIHLVEQDTANGQYGTTIPVWLCREFIGQDEQVLVFMGDDFIYNPDGSSEAARLIEAAAGGSAMVGVPIDPSEVSRYGVISTHDNPDGSKSFSHIQEKPTPQEADSNLINPSKYVFDHVFFDFLDRAVAAGPNTKGEYFITDPINDYIEAGNQIKVIEAHGEYLDCGNVDTWLAANNFVAAHTQ